MPAARKTPAKPKTASLFARITSSLYDEAHIDLCRTKYPGLSEEAFVTLMRKAVEIGADPLRGDIYIKVRDGGFNVMATVAAMRAYAEAQGDYAGDDQTLHILKAGSYKPEVGATASVLVKDPALVDEKTNPEGIEYCSMGVYRRIHGEWRRFSHTVAWKDYVPLYGGEIAGEAWRNLPVVMIQKVAEVGALRKAYPKLGAIYVEEEFAQADSKQRTEGRFSDTPKAEPPRASEPEPREVKARGRRAPVAVKPAPEPATDPFRGVTIEVNFLNGRMVPVEVEAYADRVANFLQELLDRGHPQKVVEWFEKNPRARQDFYNADARNGHQNAMRLKRFREIAERRMQVQAEKRRGGRPGQRTTTRRHQEARA